MTQLSEDIHRARMEKLAQWVRDTVALHDMAGLDREEAAVAVIGMLTQTLVGVMLVNVSNDENTVREFLRAGIDATLQVHQRTKQCAEYQRTKQCAE